MWGPVARGQAVDVVDPAAHVVEGAAVGGEDEVAVDEAGHLRRFKDFGDVVVRSEPQAPEIC